MTNRFAEQLLAFIVIPGFIIFGTLVFVKVSNWELQQPVNPDSPSLAGVSIADSVAFELKAESITQVVFVGEIPITGDTVCAYIADTTMYVQQFVTNKEPFHKYQNKMFRFIWNN